uniref:Uncharacterized protein n=1 Tax=Arundo donax TaxID=35708 RepID=A0A0A9ETN3_ARUDO
MFLKILFMFLQICKKIALFQFSIELLSNAKHKLNSALFQFPYSLQIKLTMPCFYSPTAYRLENRIAKFGTELNR